MEEWKNDLKHQSLFQLYSYIIFKSIIESYLIKSFQHENQTVLPIIILLSSLYFLISCAKPEDTISNSKDNDTDSTQLPIGPRSDIGCEDCVEQSHCCCKVILDQEDPIILEICGVTIIWENPCSLNTGAGPCYSIGSRAIQDTLDESNTAIYFCCFPGSSFALHNRNGSGSGRVKVGCSSTIGLGPLLEVNLDYGNGSYVRHFLSNNACEIDSCDW